MNFVLAFEIGYPCSSPISGVVALFLRSATISSVNLYTKLRKIYDQLPLTPRQRHQLGVLKRRFMGAQGTRPISKANHEHAGEGKSTTLLPTGLQPNTVVVFYGVIDWHFRYQRPQQLALALAQWGFRVFYISVNFVDDSKPGFRTEVLHPSLTLHQIFLHVSGAQSIYQDTPSEAVLQQQRIGQRMLWEHFEIRDAIHIVQHPYWTDLAAAVSQAKLVYDCMDFHAGFSNTSEKHHKGEMALIRCADLVIVSSDFLYDYVASVEPKKIALVRNGAEFDRFKSAYSNQAHSASFVIGYYGAIAEWFDVDLVKAVAIAFPEARVCLIGADTVGAAAELAGINNIEFTGELPYSELPRHLATFSVCLIPFKILPLTLATNPVKVYEYLSAGKAVVAVDLPELKSMSSMVYTASSRQGFVDAIRLAVSEDCDDLRRSRQAFAATQTWQARANELQCAIAAGKDDPLVSVIIVSYNQWHLTARCLLSLSAAEIQGEYGLPIEIIVVDNASEHSCTSELIKWSQLPVDRGGPVRSKRIVLNTENRGFGPAVNQGLRQAVGQYLVVLNNDTIVTPGWARGLVRHFMRNPELGLIGPVTNNIGNESKIDLISDDLHSSLSEARRYNLDRGGMLYRLRIAAFFCVMMPRHVFEMVGELDERFVPGFFEDDDYCLRVQKAGLRIACAEDVFVYHELSASFDQLSVARRQAIFDRNKSLFEEKWGPWVPHKYRPESTQSVQKSLEANGYPR